MGDPETSSSCWGHMGILEVYEQSWVDSSLENQTGFCYIVSKEETLLSVATGGQLER
jgi:hypothetical protein